jgi:hypothetical protein
MTNNPCLICIIALILLFTSIVSPIVATATTTLTQLKTQPQTLTVHQAFERALDPIQKETYERIVKRRRTIYVQGLLLGVLLACVVVGIVMHCAPMQHSIGYGCVGVVVLFVTLFLYYILSPKPEYIVNVLHTEEQRVLWMKVYRRMQVSMYGSFAFACVGSFVLFTCVIPITSR